MKTTFLTSCALATLTVPLLAQSHTHGSMVGSLQPTSVVVWTRASGPALVSVLWNTAPTPTGAAETGRVLVKAADDFTAHITLTGLTPDTRYYYATRIANPTTPSNNQVGPFGEFKTPPAAGPGKVTFVASADVLNKPEYVGFDKMRAEGADFYLSLGDMPYADSAKNQAEYWLRHKDTRNAPEWLRFIEKLPVEGTWDDHEVINDWDKNTNPQLTGYGKKAFFDYFPLPQGSTELYRSIRWGNAVEIFVLDLRAHRDANITPSSSSKSMLGATQKAWLKNALLASKAKFKILCSSVPLRWGSFTLDKWDGFPHEREELLRFLVTNKIRNVVVLSADSHLMGVHNHREGIHEYQCGPLAASVQPQYAAPPEVRFRASVLNYLKVTADSTVTPATLRVDLIAATGKVMFTDTLKAEEPADLTVQTDVANGGYQLKGPFYFRNRGWVELPVVTPGRYNVSFEPDPTERHRPTDIDLTIPPNSVVAVSGRWRELPGAKVLFQDTFDGPLTGYTVIDQAGSTNGPSAWLVSSGELQQSNRIDGLVGSHDSDRPGTHLITGDGKWKDYTVAARVRSHERGRVGVVFRYRDENNFYRFVIDEQRPLRRLEKRVRGAFTTLAEQKIPYVAHNDHDIKCSAVGNRLRVVIDDQLIFDVTDSAHASGKVGLYTWQNQITNFEDLVVTEGHDARGTANDVFTDTFEDNSLQGWNIVDHAVQSGQSIWFENVGVLFQMSNIGDMNVAQPLSRPGTVCLASASVPNDVQFTVSMQNYDDDGMGVVFRYRDANNHYRFNWNRELRIRQLEKVVNGNWSVLWQDDRDFNLGQWYQVRVLAIGPRLRLYVNGEPLADVTDQSHASGTVGTYAWRSAPLLFDRAIIQRPQVELPVLAAVTQGLQSRLIGRAPLDGGDFYGLAISLARSPGIPLAILNAADPRVLELAGDRLFIESLRPGPLWSGFAGKLDAAGYLPLATINWPNLPSLRGLKVYASGWTGDISRVPIKNVFPTLEVIYP